MKTLMISLGFSLAALTFSYAQTFTMGKKCRAALEAAQTPLSQGAYNDALTQFEAFSGDCKTKDAKEAMAIGKAEAYNGLGNYD